jgi:hypothetical protein
MTLSYDDLTDLAGHRTITDVPCPLCGPGRRSPTNRKRKVLRIWRTEHGFSSYYCARCGASGYALANGVKIEPRRCSVAAEARPARDDADQQARIEIALKLWDAAVPLRSCPGNRGEPIVTTGWLYLIECRGLRVGLLDNDLAHALRWHEDVGAVIALMTDPLTGEPCGIHRTFINPDGTKRDRKMLGKAGVIRVSPDENLEQLGITEGIEDALAVLLSGFSPVWAATSAGAIERFPVIPGVKHLLVFGDNDEVGRRAAHHAAHRYKLAGACVALHFPAGGEDWGEALSRKPA